MNFGEKLTNLRKQKGLSQEELGYELNVTRQTVSKWELGQTTPEMDKLVELSKIFGVTVDELTNTEEITNNEASKIEDMPINDKPQNNSSLKVILIIIAVFIIGGIAVYGFVFSKIFNFGKGVFDEVTNQAGDIGNLISGTIKDQIEGIKEESEKFNQQYSEMEEKMNEKQKEMEKAKEEFEQQYNQSEDWINNVQKDMDDGQKEFDQMKDQVLEMIQKNEQNIEEKRN